MKIGFAVPVSGSWATPENQRALSHQAEELGYDSIWTFQRLLYPAAPDSPRWQEAYRSVQDPLVTLSYLAGLTSRVRLGVAVLNAPFYSPALLGKQLTTLDIVSGGRLDVGLGLGWAAEEYAAVGVGFGRRGRRLEEFLRALDSLWTDEVVDFRGDFYELPSVRMEPKPVQRPRPPVLLGGSAEPALRRAGRLADGWISSSGADLATVGATIELIKDAALEAGRDPDALRFVSRGVVRVRDDSPQPRRPLTGSLRQIRADIDSLADQGITEVFVDLNFDPEVGSPDADPVAAVRKAHAVLDALAP